MTISIVASRQGRDPTALLKALEFHPSVPPNGHISISPPFSGVDARLYLRGRRTLPALFSFYYPQIL